MEFVAKELLINFVFVLLPLFFVQMFYLVKYTRQSKKMKNWMVAIFPILSIVLCMSFSAEMMEGFVVDFRRIPLILGVLYGGPWLGLLLLALILMLRFLQGGDGFAIALLMYPLLTFFLIYLSKSYHMMSLKKRLLISIFVLPGSESLLLFMITQLFPVNIPGMIQLQLMLLNMTSLLIAMVIWEVIRQSFELMQKVAKAEKLEVVSHLAASMSHEVRNPLTVTRGFMQLLHEDLPKEQRKEYLDLAIRELDRSVAIINDYLTFARPSIEKNEKIDICLETQRSMNVLTPHANMHGITIKRFIPAIPIYVIGQTSKFKQCLINIVKNAIEAMPNGGEINVTIQDDHPSVHLMIEDSGEGMTTEQINRLGEPYFTTKSKGTGLGMMVSYSIIQSMKGEITVNSTKGKGTCFTITLPIGAENE
ncbi:ATP-binding protein [Bacillus sp. REN10]|uniref:ATP-binding protein n=1 Tax=Bacillus sp. REN10 TaxID=2782541 RepID=UPI00193BD326|nr:ATP-binding protein [Bacillus sp. REN10]